METKQVVKCLALIYFMLSYAHCLTKKNNKQNVLEADNPEEFVEEAEKQVNEVNHLRVISDQMNKYLSENTLDMKKFCEGDLSTCKSVVERYVERCKKGDCYTLDNVKVFYAPGKFEIQLPHLAQYEAAKFVFKNSGARQAWHLRFRDLFHKKKGERSTTEFNNELMKRNLARMDLPESNGVALLNEAYFSATIYYQRYLNSAWFAKLNNQNRFGRALFRVRHRGNLIRMVNDLVGEKTMSLSHSDLKALGDSFVLYLTVGNYKPLWRLSLSFADLVKHAVSKAMGYRKLGFLMADYLLKYPVDPNTYCRTNAEATCKEHLTNFLDRCDEGDCTTFDRVDLLDSKDWLNTKLPELPQVAVSVDLFLGSKARAPNWFKKVLFNRWNRMTPGQFKDLLYDRNAANLTYTTKNQGILHRYLYKSALEYVFRAKGVETFKKLGDASKTLLNFMSTVAGKDKLFLPVERVTTVLAQYRNYLFKSGIDVPLPTVNTFTRDVQHVLFSYLEDPHGGEYNDKYADEWKKLKEKEAEEEEKLKKKAEEKEAETEAVTGGFAKFWDSLTTKKTEEEKRKDEAMEEAKKKMNEKMEQALKDFEKTLQS